jgi:hypothetical protein
MAWDIIYYPYFDGAYWQYLLFLNYKPIAAAGLGIVIGLQNSIRRRHYTTFSTN